MTVITNYVSTSLPLCHHNRADKISASLKYRTIKLKITAVFQSENIEGKEKKPKCKPSPTRSPAPPAVGQPKKFFNDSIQIAE